MKYLLIILIFLLPALVFAQDTNAVTVRNDSVPSKPKFITHKDSLQKDSARKMAFNQNSVLNDSLHKDSAITSVANAVDSTSDTSKQTASVKVLPGKKVIQKNTVQLMPGAVRKVNDHDTVFYILLFLLFFLGLIKTSFPKYVNSIFSLSFQATFRQTQTREQMAQNFFPAFMLNLLFVLCGGLFVTLYARSNNWTQLEFWQLFIYSTLILLLIYVIKYIIISFIGWVFNTKEAATEYRFVVFLINKLLAILLLPLLFLIAYANNEVKHICITIAICLAFFSLGIRYLVSLSRIRKNLSITAFHFFIYLCAVEIMPLLVIYKVLFLQTSNR